MTNPDPTVISAYERALGTPTIHALAERGLIRSISCPTFERVEQSLVTDRVHGAVLGLAVGDAFAGWIRNRGSHDPVTIDEIRQWLAGRRCAGETDEVSAMTQTFVITAEALLHDLCRAPLVVAEQLAIHKGTLRSPGRATRHSITRAERGAAWFEAASPSYGDAALPRAVAVGLGLHQHSQLIGVAASLDTIVTHAARRAASSSAALAAIIAGLVTRPADDTGREVLREVIASIDHHGLASALAGSSSRSDVGRPFEPTAVDAMRVAVRIQETDDDLAGFLHAATMLSGGDRATLAIVAALYGTRNGVNDLPRRVDDLEGAEAFMRLADRLAETRTITPPTQRSESSAGADIWFLVDRSGSMSSISEFVVSGFDEFFTKQRADAGEATVTVVQFDDESPHDVIVDGVRLDRVPSIRDRFRPRGMTPLYDAVGLLLDRAERRGGDDADQLVVILTDGMENASTRWTHHDLFRRIADLRRRGWTFVFLGANQNSYDTGGRMSMPAGNVSNFRPDESGVHAAYTGLDRTVRKWRGKARHERVRDADHFWGNTKEAEELR